MTEELTGSTAAAMRAAEKIMAEIGITDREQTRYVADLIDAETGLPELIAALRWSVSKIVPYTARIKGQNEAYCDAYDQARAALARYEKP